MDSRGFSLPRPGHIQNADHLRPPPILHPRGLSRMNQVYHEIGFVKPPGHFRVSSVPPASRPQVRISVPSES